MILDPRGFHLIEEDLDLHEDMLEAFDEIVLEELEKSLAKHAEFVRLFGP